MDCNLQLSISLMAWVTVRRDLEHCLAVLRIVRGYYPSFNDLSWSGHSSDAFLDSKQQMIQPMLVVPSRQNTPQNRSWSLNLEHQLPSYDPPGLTSKTKTVNLTSWVSEYSCCASIVRMATTTMDDVDATTTIDLNDNTTQEKRKTLLWTLLYQYYKKNAVAKINNQPAC